VKQPESSISILDISPIRTLGRAFVLLCLIQLSSVALSILFACAAIFQKHCFSCPRRGQAESGLRLDLKRAALRGATVWPNIFQEGGAEFFDPIVRGDDATCGSTESEALSKADRDTDAVDRRRPCGQTVDLVSGRRQARALVVQPLSVPQLPATNNNMPRNISTSSFSPDWSRRDQPRRGGPLTLLRRLHSTSSSAAAAEQVDALSTILAAIPSRGWWMRCWVRSAMANAGTALVGCRPLRDTHGFEVNTPVRMPGRIETT